MAYCFFTLLVFSYLHVYIQISSRRELSKKSSARPKTPDSVKSKSVSVSHKSKSVQDRKGGEEADLEQGEETGEGEELEEDETEADTIEEEQEEPLHDGYAFRQGVYIMPSMLGKNSSRQHFEIFFFFFFLFFSRK